MISGPNQVEIGSKSGPNQVRAEGFNWVGSRGVGPAGKGPVAPRKVSIIEVCSVDSWVACLSRFLCTVLLNAIAKHNYIKK